MFEDDDDDIFAFNADTRQPASSSKSVDNQAAQAPMSAVTARIIRVDEQVSMLMQRFTTYIVEVNDFGRTLEVAHRYSEFDELYQQLQTDTGIIMPAMPPKGTDGTDPNVVKQRRLGLQKVLDFMLTSSAILMDKELGIWKFLNLTDASLIASRFISVPAVRKSLLLRMTWLNEGKFNTPMPEEFEVIHRGGVIVRKGPELKSAQVATLRCGTRLQVNERTVNTQGTNRLRCAEGWVSEFSTGTELRVVEPVGRDVQLGEPPGPQDVFRLAHPGVTTLLVEALRELQRDGSEHWCRQAGGRTAVCQLLAGAMGNNDKARARLAEADIVNLLLSVLAYDEAALEDVRIALNVIVAREGTKFADLLAAFLNRGGLQQLLSLAMREKTQEFVAKLLWLFWDVPVRRVFVQPGSGMRLLQSLTQGSSFCAFLACIMLAAIIAHGDISDQGHRGEALQLVRQVLDKLRGQGPADPQLGKALCASTATVARLAPLLKDLEVAPLLITVLCTTKPPAAKMEALVKPLGEFMSLAAGDKQASAQAAELLLHLGGTTGVTTSAGNIECAGIAEREASMEQAMRWQLDEGLVKSQGLQQARLPEIEKLDVIIQNKLRALPSLDCFAGYGPSCGAFEASRANLEQLIGASQSLQHNMQAQLLDLKEKTRNAQSASDLQYKEKLLAIEQLHAEVKRNRAALAAAEVEARESQRSADASSHQLRRTEEQLKQLCHESNELRASRSVKETEAFKLQHRADTPGLQQMKEQIAESLQRNLTQAKELQVQGQRVQQGDPDYLRPGESREQKIQELTRRLSELKKQHQELLQQQKEYEFDPSLLRQQVASLQADCADMQTRIDNAESRRLEAERSRAELTGTSLRDSETARASAERVQSLARQIRGAESQLRMQMEAVQPLIQHRHEDWQKIIGQQKQLETDQYKLVARLQETQLAGQSEDEARTVLSKGVRELISSLQGLETFLGSLNDGTEVPTEVMTNNLFEPGSLPAESLDDSAFGE